MKDRPGRVRLGGEHEQSDAGGRRGWREVVVLLKHIEEVVVGGERNKGVEIMVRELVLESELIRKLEGLGELDGEGRKAGCGAAVYGDDAGVATGVAE